MVQRTQQHAVEENECRAAQQHPRPRGRRLIGITNAVALQPSPPHGQAGEGKQLRNVERIEQRQIGQRIRTAVVAEVGVQSPTQQENRQRPCTDPEISLRVTHHRPRDCVPLERQRREQPAGHQRPGDQRPYMPSLDDTIDLPADFPRTDRRQQPNARRVNKSHVVALGLIVPPQNPQMEQQRKRPRQHAVPGQRMPESMFDDAHGENE